jgi:SNF2 family DNA or RNA helicase
MLIACLANSRGMLDEHHREWFKGDRPVQCVYSSKDKIDPEAHVVTSYSLTPKILDKVGDVDFALLDEYHSLANIDTAQTQASVEFLKHQTCPILGMSGTPIRNCPIDLWPLLYHFGPKWARMTYREFAYKYCYPYTHQGRFIVKGFRNPQELQFNLRATCLTRRKLEEVRDDLAEPEYRFAYVEPDESIKADIATEKKMHELQGMETKGWSLGTYAKARHQIAMSKIDAVVSVAEEALKTHDKICVFGHTVALVKELEHRLQRYGAVRITGDTPAKKRDANVRRFQTDPRCRVFCGNIKAAGTAITLTAANVMILAEASWVPSDNEQVIGRIRRHGQAKQTYVVFVVVRGSLDENLLRKAYGKKQGVELALDRKGE